MSAETAAAHFHCKQMTLKVVMCQRRGRRRERTRASEREAGKVTLRRKDSLSMQKNVVNTTRALRVASWGHIANQHARFLDTSRHNEREKEAGCRNGNVAVKVPPRMFFLRLSCIIISSLSPIPHTNAAKKGLCRRARASRDFGFVVCRCCSASAT